MFSAAAPRGRVVFVLGVVFFFLVATAWQPVRAASSRATLEQLLREGRFDAAEHEARRWIRETPAGHDESSLERAAVLDVLVESLWRSGKDAAAETRELAFEAVRIKEAVLGTDDPALAKSLENLGYVLQRGGDHAGALPLLERALRIREHDPGSDRADVARVLNYLGWVVYRLGDVERARATYERALELREAQLGPRHPDVAASLANLAIVLKHQGEYRSARGAYERALDIQRDTLGPDHGDVASTLNNLAILLKDRGDYVAALDSYEQALQIAERRFGRDHPRVARILNNVALLRSRLGDFASALRDARRAVGTLRDHADSQAGYLARALDNLATIHFRAGDLLAAEAAQQEAQAIRERVFGRDHVATAESRNNLGALRLERGDLAGAQELLEEALAVRSELLGEDHPQLVGTLLNLAKLWRQRGELERAQQLGRRALDICESKLGEDHPLMVEILFDVAETSAAAGEGKTGVELAMRAAAVGGEHVRLTALGLPQREALGYRASGTASLDLALGLAERNATGPGETLGQLWDLVIRSRGLVLDEMKWRSSVAHEQRPLARVLEQATTRLANLLVRGAEGESSESYRGRFLAARRERDDAERALASASLRYRRQHDVARIGLADVRDALPERWALVAYTRYESPRGAHDARYAAFVLPADGSAPRVVALGSASAIDRLARRWRESVESAREVLPMLERSVEAAYRAAGAELRRTIWDPLTRYLDDIEGVFVVPDGALHLVNLSTLPTDGGQYLVETGPTVHYLAAERDLVRILKDARRDLAKGKGLLVVGGPDYDSVARPKAQTVLRPRPDPAGDRCVGLSLEFPSLFGAAREADLIARLWSDEAREDERAVVVELRGAQATEGRVKRQSPGRRVLHLATHGFHVSEPCENARDPVDPSGPAVAGLALAGANRLPWIADEEADDGVLTAEEIATIDLSGVEWVVLSACDTGAGRLQPGEGLLGLRRSFEIAGARTVIMSLWSVEDTSTRNWMRRLYELRLQGQPTAAAIRNTSRAVLEVRRQAGESTHPFYWGPFIAAGDWR